MSIHVQIINKSKHDLPKYATEYSAGVDLCANIEDDIVLKPLERILVPTGISIALPIGFEAQIRPRSGNAYKFGLTVLNSPGTIDSDYRGEIKVLLVNLSSNSIDISNGDKIAQMVVARYEHVLFESVTVLNETVRGEGGFGHTGTI